MFRDWWNVNHGAMFQREINFQNIAILPECNAYPSPFAPGRLPSGDNVTMRSCTLRPVIVQNRMEVCMPQMLNTDSRMTMILSGDDGFILHVF